MDSASNSSAPGVWYSIIGASDTINFLVLSNHDTQITVFRGSCNEGLVCEDGNDDSPGPLVARGASSGLSLLLNSGQTYYILVHGFDGSVGPFVLEVETVLDASERPTNDKCQNATLIEPSSTSVTGSTLLASLEPDLSYCGTATSKCLLFNMFIQPI